jgi:hypothetical protein
MTARDLLYAAVLTALCGTVACSAPKNGIKSPGERDPLSNTNENLVPQASQYPQPVGLDPNASLVDATYRMNVTSLLGIEVCKGDIQIKINPAFDKQSTNKIFDIPEGVLSCGMLGQINLAQALGAFNSVKPPDLLNGAEPVEVKDHVLRVKQLGYGLYNPARPLLPTFLSATPEELRRIQASSAVTLQDTKAGKTAQGNVALKVTTTGGVETPELIGKKFRKIMVFEVLNTGFDGVDKLSNFLFEKMEFKVSLQPLAILSIYFEGRISDVAGSMGGGGAVLPQGPIISALTKVIKVKMKADLISMEGLDGDQDDEDIEEHVE